MRSIITKISVVIEPYRQFVAVCSGQFSRKALSELALFLAAGPRLCVAGAKTETRASFFPFSLGWHHLLGFRFGVIGVAVPGSLKIQVSPLL